MKKSAASTGTANGSPRGVKGHWAHALEDAVASSPPPQAGVPSGTDPTVEETAKELAPGPPVAKRRGRPPAPRPAADAPLAEKEKSRPGRKKRLGLDGLPLPSAAASSAGSSRGGRRWNAADAMEDELGDDGAAGQGFFGVGAGAGSGSAALVGAAQRAAGQLAELRGLGAAVASEESARGGAHPSLRKAFPWKLVDDITIKDIMQQHSDFFYIAEHVHFSGRYKPTPADIEARWVRLLYDRAFVDKQFAPVAQFRPPQWHKRSAWTVAEENLLREKLMHNGAPGYKRLLEGHREMFHSSRTAKSIEAHYYRMKKSGTFEVLDAHTPMPLLLQFRESDFASVSYVDAEGRALRLPTLTPTGGDAAMRDTAYQDAEQLLELETDRLTAALATRDPRRHPSLALLRGTLLRVELKAAESLIGYAGAGVGADLDVNLRDEGECAIAAHQALLRLRSDGYFYLRNLGTPEAPGAAVIVNGLPVQPNCSRVVPDNALIEFGSFALLFCVNVGLLAAIRKALAKEANPPAEASAEAVVEAPLAVDT